MVVVLGGSTKPEPASAGAGSGATARSVSSLQGSGCGFALGYKHGAPTELPVPFVVRPSYTALRRANS